MQVYCSVTPRNFRTTIFRSRRKLPTYILKRYIACPHVHQSTNGACRWNVLVSSEQCKFKAEMKASFHSAWRSENVVIKKPDESHRLSWQIQWNFVQSMRSMADKCPQIRFLMIEVFILHRFALLWISLFRSWCFLPWVIFVHEHDSCASDNVHALFLKSPPYWFSRVLSEMTSANAI